MKRRHEFYLKEEVSERLATVAAKRGSSKTGSRPKHSRLTSIGAGTELDERFKARLDKLSVQLGRIERDQQVVAETLALLARFQFMVAAPSSNSDRAARGLARERFKLFIEQVTRRISNGHGLVEDVLSLTSPAETNYEL